MNRSRGWSFWIVIGILAGLNGCSKPSPPPSQASARTSARTSAAESNPTPPPVAANTSNFAYDTFLADANRLATETTAANKSWGLGTFDRWDLDQENGKIVFSNEDGTKVEADAQLIGSFETKSQNWRWAWANKSILDSMKKDSEAVRDFGAKHGLAKLTEAGWDGTEDDGWQMAALALKINNRKGIYRGKAGSMFVYITFGEVTITKADASGVEK